MPGRHESKLDLSGEGRGRRQASAIRRTLHGLRAEGDVHRLLDRVWWGLTDVAASEGDYKHLSTSDPALSFHPSAHRRHSIHTRP